MRTKTTRQQSALAKKPLVYRKFLDASCGCSSEVQVHIISTSSIIIFTVHSPDSLIMRMSIAKQQHTKLKTCVIINTLYLSRAKPFNGAALFRVYSAFDIKRNIRHPIRYFCYVAVINGVLTDAFSECSQSGQGIELSSSLDHHNRSAACPGETVVYSCTVANTGGLEWAVESFHSFGSNSIVLSVAYNPVGTVIEYEGGLITANVTAALPYMVYWGEITSTLTLLAHKSFQNKTVWCSNGVLDQSKSPCILHKYGGEYNYQLHTGYETTYAEVIGFTYLPLNTVPPSAPLFPIYTIIYRNIATFTVFVEWTIPQNDGGLGITNYTATLRAPFSQHTYHVDVSDKLYIALFYNKMYVLQISATNCGGIGPTANISNIYSGS